jgi:hypothetical protein
MKLVLILLAITTALLLNSCSKKNEPLADTGSGYWELNNYTLNKTYTIHNTIRHLRNGYTVLSGMDAAAINTHPNLDTINLWFKNMPVITANYKVVEFKENNPLEKDEMGITIDIPGKGTFRSTGIVSNTTWLPASAIVTFNNNKLTIDIPYMTVVGYATYIDTTSFQGKLIEK